MIDLIRYVVVCLLFAAAGFGTIRLARVRLGTDAELLLGASVTQALVTIVLGVAVIAGWPLKQVTLPLWLVVIVLAVYGARVWWRESPASQAVAEQRQASILLGVSMLAAPVVMLPYFVLGLADYPGSGMLDGWAYAVFGQYLWEYPRDTQGGLAVVHQFAVHLGHTRFIAASELGFLSWLSNPGDTQWASGLLRALSLFTLASACGAFARIRGLAFRFAPLYVAIAAMSGWALDIVWVNNYDQGLELHYLPALATLASALPLLSWPGAIVTGALASGVLFTYPEFAVLALGIAGLFALEAMLHRRDPRALITGAIVLLATVAFSLPYWRDLYGFFLNQIRSGMSAGPRPGAGTFLGLLDPYAAISALFALGGEWLTPSLLPITVKLGAVLAVLCLLGLGRLLWQREAALLVAAAGLATTTFILLIREQYAYGAYKVLALGWWIAAFVIVSGLAWLHDRLQRFAKQPWPMAAVLVPGLIVPAVTTARAYIETRDAPAERISDYRAIERLPDAIGDAPVALAAWDSNAAHWGAYFLRRANLFMAVRPGYLGAPHVAPLINAARQAPVDRIRYVILESSSGLARASGWRLVWGVGRLTVWDTAPVGWAVVTGVRDALGNDVLPSPYFHTGPPGAAVQVISSRSGMLTVSGRLFNALIPDDHSCWQLAMSGPGGAPAQELTLKAGTATLDTPIPAGRSTFELRAKTVVPTPFSAQDGRREAGFADLAARLRPPAPAGTDGVPGPPQAETPCHGS